MHVFGSPSRFASFGANNRFQSDRYNNSRRMPLALWLVTTRCAIHNPDSQAARHAAAGSAARVPPAARAGLGHRPCLARFARNPFFQFTRHSPETLFHAPPPDTLHCRQPDADDICGVCVPVPAAGPVPGRQKKDMGAPPSIIPGDISRSPSSNLTRCIFLSLPVDLFSALQNPRFGKDPVHRNTAVALEATRKACLHLLLGPVCSNPERKETLSSVSKV